MGMAPQDELPDLRLTYPAENREPSPELLAQLALMPPPQWPPPQPPRQPGPIEQGIRIGVIGAVAMVTAFVVATALLLGGCAVLIAL